MLLARIVYHSTVFLLAVTPDAFSDEIAVLQWELNSGRWSQWLIR